MPSTSRLHLQKIASDDPGHGRFGSGSKEWIDGFAGSCHLHLSDAKSAEVILRRSADIFGVDDKKHKAETLGGLTVALIRQRDPDQAAAVLHQAISLLQLESALGACGMQRVFMAGRELRPWIGEPFVQDVAARLLAWGGSLSRH